MVNAHQFKKLQYEHEVLWSRYDIRDHYLKKIVQGVYENIGQVLSLVRVQLSLLSSESESSKENATGPGYLVGQAIQDLRSMCRDFYPETELLAKKGIVQTLENELKLLENSDRQSSIKVEGEPNALETGTELIVFRMLQEMLFAIREQYKEGRIQLKVIYDKDQVRFKIEYTGSPVEWKASDMKVDGSLTLRRLSLLERTKLIDGKLQTRYRNNKTRIELVVPFKTFIYEQ